MADPILELKGLNKSFGPVHVLHDIDFAVYPGEVTALVGDNGAGKSTIVKCVAGIYSIDSGQIFWEGEPVTIHDPRAASAIGIEVVYQDLALADNLDITQNMFLGREIRRFGFLADGEMERKAREVLSRLSVRTVSSVRQVVVEPLRWPAPDGGDRQGRALEQPGGLPRRAHGCARRRPDPPGARPGPPLGRSGPRCGADLAQHERRVGGRRPDLPRSTSVGSRPR